MSPLLSVDKECLFWTCFLLASLCPVLFLHHIKNWLFIGKSSWHYRDCLSFLYSVFHLPEFFFPYCQLCKESRSGKLHQFFFHASASVTYVCRCVGMHPSVEQQCSTVTWAALKENLVFNVGFLKAFLVAIANSHNSNVTCWLADVLSTLAFPSELSM